MKLKWEGSVLKSTLHSHFHNAPELHLKEEDFWSDVGILLICPPKRRKMRQCNWNYLDYAEFIEDDNLMDCPFDKWEIVTLYEYTWKNIHGSRILDILSSPRKLSIHSGPQCPSFLPWILSWTCHPSKVSEHEEITNNN